MKSRFAKWLLILALSSRPCFSQPHEHLWAGANAYQLWYQSPKDIQKQLDAMQQAGLKVLRIILGVRSDYRFWEDPPEPYTFENPFGVFNDSLLAKVDHLILECKYRGILLVIALENGNQNKPYADTYGIAGQYTNPAAVAALKNRFRHFLEHEHPVLKRPWKDLDEIILAWEISNEPGIRLASIGSLSSAEKTDILRNWLREMSSYLKALDPNTFVSLGIAGYDRYYVAGTGDDFLALGNIPDADIYTYHFYGGNLDDWIEDVQDSLESWNKLLFVEEFGLERQEGDAAFISFYNDVTQKAMARGIPWMFWMMGPLKHGSTWEIMEGDPVWDVVVQRAGEINSRLTRDPWSVDEKTAVCADVWEGFNTEQPRNWFSWPEGYPGQDDALECGISDRHVEEGSSSLECPFDPEFSDRDYATFFTTQGGPYDWDLADSLRIDVYNESADPIRIDVILETGPDRTPFTLVPLSGNALHSGWNRSVGFSLEDIAQKGWIQRIFIRLTGFVNASAVFLDNWRLISAYTLIYPADQPPPPPDIQDRPLAVFPNPFVNETWIGISLSDNEEIVSVEVFNILGQKIRTFQKPQSNSGYCRILWNGRDSGGNPLPCGIFIIRLRTSLQTLSTKTVFLGP